jgi:ABC-type antimicrobial peptide transport system permease subunit
MKYIANNYSDRILFARLCNCSISFKWIFESTVSTVSTPINPKLCTILLIWMSTIAYHTDIFFVALLMLLTTDINLDWTKMYGAGTRIVSARLT